MALLGALISHQAWAWGAVEGRYGGAAYRGPYSAGVRTPSGAAAVRGPAGNVAVRGPTYGYGAYGYHGPTYYGGIRLGLSQPELPSAQRQAQRLLPRVRLIRILILIIRRRITRRTILKVR